MRRNLILAAACAAGLTGCGNFRDLFSAHADVAAEAGGRDLTATRLSQILVGGGKQVRLDRQTVEFVANAWVDFSLLAKAAADGKLPEDSASVAQAVWPEISELKGTHWHDSLMASRSVVSDAAVDSLYSKSDIRLLQHMLFGVRPKTEPAQRSATLARARAALADIRKGANFGAVASTLSEDPGSKADSGYLPPGPKGRFVAAFDSAGWSLKPGEVSAPVETPFGFHLLRRPPLQEARRRMRDYLIGIAGVRLDSLYMDSLAISSKMTVAKDAPAAMRSALESMDDSRNSSKTLVSYRGGGLTVKDFVRWIGALPPQYTSQLHQADDPMLARFARLLTQNVLLLRQADSAGIQVTPDEWNSLRSRYTEVLDSLQSDLGLDAAKVKDSSVSAAEREKVAALTVDRFFDRLMEGKARLRPIPAGLSSLLRERMSYKIHDAGLNRALELASAEKAKSDSARGPGDVLKRAPGGPPIPGLGGPPGGGGQAQPVPAPTAPPPARPGKKP